MRKEEMFDTPKKKVSLDVTNLENFVYDMSRCIKCKGCYWVEHTYMPGINFSVRCPSNLWNDFDAYGAFGKMRIGIAIQEGRLKWTDKLLEIIYADPLCGACDVGCKRNLDLEIELTLEALRIKAVKDGVGPMPAHKKIAKNIETKHNQFGAVHENRKKWISKDINVAEKADVLYFVGCSSSYVNQGIAKSTAKILNAAGTDFMLMGDEWCCGNTLYSVGMIDEAREIAKRNIEAVKASGAKTLLVSCAECYRMWKVDYPKMLNIATADLGFEVIHLIEFADKAIANNSLKPKKSVDVRFTYHDACSVSRLCDPWTPWEGERGWMGTVSPRLKRRRGQQGLYFQARNILNAIPGAKFVEMPRTRENALCCGAGRGTKEAFPELAQFSAKQRIDEVKYVSAEVLVSACPWCKTNFTQAIKENGDGIKVMDISEFILSSLEI
ncbi:MAG TPA: (Fe-S)-binding protein [Syntrophorhabdaceae bacterium]|nr:(Fe-S)-binding protein [Syntrophorhabdaceae bacterium]HPU29752.1 (Fe-S)-binding protein [Syntrophorhabdaceae bacterium]